MALFKKLNGIVTDINIVNSRMKSEQVKEKGIEYSAKKSFDIELS
jgi:hypothetical protein